MDLRNNVHSGGEVRLIQHFLPLRQTNVHQIHFYFTSIRITTPHISLDLYARYVVPPTELTTSIDRITPTTKSQSTKSSNFLKKTKHELKLNEKIYNY